jgi:murein DD-endopeptidase MepM/ murein hydrolase activator NlpD
VTPSSRIAAVVVGLSLFTSLLKAAPVAALDCSGVYDSLCEGLNDARGQQSATAQSLKDIESKIKDTQARAAAVQILIVQLNGQIKGQQGEIDKTQLKIDELEMQIRLTEADMARRQAHLAVRAGILNQRVRGVDKHGSINYMEMVVTAQSFNQLVDRVMIMHDIVRADRRLMDDLQRQREQLGVIKGQLDGKRVDMARLLSQQQEQKAKLEQSKKQQEEAKAYLDRLEAEYEDQRRVLQAQKAELDRLIQDLQTIYDAAAAAGGGGSGIFGWPMASRNITQGYGCSSLLGEPIDSNVCKTWPYRAHTGLDIAGPYGSGVYAADTGIVTSVIDSWGGGYGNNVIITHGNGYATLYAHLSAITVRKGQAVVRGQQIGAEGSTGFSTGPHLHFEIRLGGRYLNPCAYIGC